MGVDAQAQRFILGGGNFRRVVLVIRPAVALDLERQPLVLDLGLGLGELIPSGGDQEDHGRGDRQKHDGGVERHRTCKMAAQPGAELRTDAPLKKNPWRMWRTRTLPPPDGQITGAV
jgi:hypothetical protein